jgi:hypothetical protein
MVELLRQKSRRAHVAATWVVATSAFGALMFGVAGCGSGQASDAVADEVSISSSECTKKFNAGEAEDVFPVMPISPDASEFSRYVEMADGNRVEAYKQYVVDQVTKGFRKAVTEAGKELHISDEQLEHVLAGARETVDKLHAEGKTLPLADKAVMFGERYNVDGSKIKDSDTVESSEYCVLIATKSDR